MISVLFTYSKILFFAAIIPAILLLIKVYRKDRLEREPLGLLISLLVLGALSTLCALLTETMGEKLLNSMNFSSETSYNFWYYFFVVALSEEGFKYLMLRKRTWKDENFNCTFDGVIYAVFVSLGFALVENIEYVFMYGLGNALLRAFTAVPGHACFGVFMGVFYGLARKYKNTGDDEISRFYSILALVAPLVLHGLYDFIATTGGTITFIVVVAGLFISSSKMMKKNAERDEYIA